MLNILAGASLRQQQALGDPSSSSTESGSQKNRRRSGVEVKAGQLAICEAWVPLDRLGYSSPDPRWTDLITFALCINTHLSSFRQERVGAHEPFSLPPLLFSSVALYFPPFPVPPFLNTVVPLGLLCFPCQLKINVPARHLQLSKKHQTLRGAMTAVLLC